jgi:4-hydroxy-tetrahydrodipicolinate synthase
VSDLNLEKTRQRFLHGLIPAVPVPFNARGEISLASQERYAAFMAGQPVAGVAVWAHTGRGLRLTRAQRLAVLEVWARAMGSRSVIVAGVGGLPGDRADFPAYTNSAVEMAEDALAHGAHALLIYPPRLFHRVKDFDELTLDFHSGIAELGAPVILFYLYEAAGGVPYSPALLRRLFSLPNVVGIKLATLDSVMTFQDVAGLIREEFPEKLVITGEDRFLGYSLMAGAESALVGMGAVATKLQADLLESFYSGRAAEFLELSRRVDRLARALFRAPMEGYIRRILWALAEQGVIEREAANDPWGPKLAESEFAELETLLKELSKIAQLL